MSNVSSRDRLPLLCSLLLGLVLLALPASAAGAWTTSPDLSKLDSLVPEFMQKWKVPGLALGIVHKGQAVYVKGFGLRDSTAEKPVDEHTVFPIGSSTKAFTALGVAMLANEGLLHLNAPVREVMPEFAVADPWVAAHATPIDLLTHRMGVLEHDMLWLWNEGIPDQNAILARLRSFPQEAPFRASFNYNNYFYLAAGKVIERVSKQTWGDFIRARILKPLRMDAALLSVEDLADVENLAQPHFLHYDGTVERISFRSLENIAPAGAINAPLTDMLKWVKFQLGAEGVAVIAPKEVVALTHRPQLGMPVPRETMDMAFPGAHFVSYGLGWFLHDYHGVKLVEHGGNIDGFTALVALAPELDMGFVVLCNMDATAIREALMYTIVDIFMGRKQHDWAGHFLAKWQKGRDAQQQAARDKEAAHVTGTSPSLPLNAYVGRYENDIFGELVVRETADGLEFEVLGKAAPLTHWHHDVFQRPFYTMDAPGIELMAFTLGSDGTVHGLTDDVMGDFRKVAVPEEG